MQHRGHADLARKDTSVLCFIQIEWASAPRVIAQDKSKLGSTLLGYTLSREGNLHAENDTDLPFGRHRDLPFGIVLADFLVVVGR